ncbi:MULTISPECIES: TetR/AcrR family transcriptional regulator [Mycolicibacterium]|uniref:Transcriptional regulator, tetR family n=2 Tax=Mycolicibacterium gilvum TaxID=1804 RepID=E6TMS7_MYCSR|nr:MULTISPECIES: TetR/AcrR family transcriptional regulator [Mycolicibacterium]ABP42791.1 transcriptional regulator, TetR family [Mycolicibacterium gilvum PYR-GCK]ADT97173.1 transcriptional regulator, tetR family [Mycolicibacterium gilvum Spyr1]MBV5246599.1 TetR/AcrR family transcriptional regulator [Mycolicibacterium sp. PAM1]
MPSEPPRRRNAAFTRAAILQSAIQHFARAGYDGAGVRDIATDAGVTAMLVNRYFGSKEKLFAEAVETSFATPVFIASESEDLARDIAAALAVHSAPGAESVSAFLIMLRSVSNPAAVRIVRAALARHAGRRLSDQLPEPGRLLRSDVALAVMSGVLLMRQVIGTRALSRSSADELETLLESVFSAVFDTPLDSRGDAPRTGED